MYFAASGPSRTERTGTGRTTVTSFDTPPIDRERSPLPAPDHDPEHIADALRNSPHILSADGMAGSVATVTSFGTTEASRSGPDL